jgi:alpha-methylacyl-CoA racemase
MRDAIAERLRQRTRDDWAAHFAGSDACVAPVLSLGEAADHPHNRARGTFIENGRLRRPAPAPRFSATPSTVAGPPSHGDTRQTAETLARFGLADEEAEALAKSGMLDQ